MSDDEFSELAARAQIVQEFIDSEAWLLISDYIKALAGPVQKRILQGGCSHDDYKHLTGVLDGMQRALDAPERLVKHVELQRHRMTQAATE